MVESRVDNFCISLRWTPLQAMTQQTTQKQLGTAFQNPIEQIQNSPLKAFNQWTNTHTHKQKNTTDKKTTNKPLRLTTEQFKKHTQQKQKKQKPQVHSLPHGLHGLSCPLQLRTLLGHELLEATLDEVWQAEEVGEAFQIPCRWKKAKNRIVIVLLFSFSF